MSQLATQQSSAEVNALVPTVVLYDVMREAANRLRGELNALEDAHPDRAQELLQARIEIARRADAVNSRDRHAIAVLDSQFRTELALMQSA